MNDILQVFVDGSDILQKLVDDHWQPALANQLISDAEDMRRSFNRSISLSTLSLAR